jgi:hypothetical protein
MKYEDWMKGVPDDLRAEVLQHRLQLLDEIIAALVKASAYQKTDVQEEMK